MVVGFTTTCAIRNPVHGEVYSIQHYVIKFVSDLRQVGGFCPDPQICSTNKTDHHDITEILLKVPLNTIKQSENVLRWFSAKNWFSIICDEDWLITYIQIHVDFCLNLNSDVQQFHQYQQILLNQLLLQTIKHNRDRHMSLVMWKYYLVQ